MTVRETIKVKVGSVLIHPDSGENFIVVVARPDDKCTDRYWILGRFHIRPVGYPNCGGLWFDSVHRFELWKI